MSDAYECSEPYRAGFFAGLQRALEIARAAAKEHAAEARRFASCTEYDPVCANHAWARCAGADGVAHLIDNAIVKELR